MQISKEKLEYLRTHTLLSPINKIKLMTLKRHGASQAELEEAEYIYRFQSYQKSWDRTWKKLNWGNSENESLSSFAEGALDSEVREQSGKSMK